jgi:predicted acylesterase/phospholipase RssA
MSDDLAGADYGSPTRTCDIVMKGGITSGVVYPHAICELARTYRFVQVGGTSAGAIAAAATAAAELGRSSGGFQELARLPDWLGGGKHLQELFQPEPGTEGLFRMLLAALEHKGDKWLWITLTGLRQFPLALLGALPGLLLIVLALADAGGALLVLAFLCGLLLALAGLLAGLALAVIRRLTTAVPDNLYGICSGNAQAEGRPPALTPWLGELIERCAGRMEAGGPPPAAPLTFGDLEAGGGPRLAMMTTNVTNHTAHRMPWAAQEYWFDPDELRRLFPGHVVDHMVAHPPAPPDQPGKEREAALYRELLAPLCPLPEPADLPIVVAARMSLSFPLLLSAVPLHKIDWSRTGNQEAEAAWRKWLQAGEPQQRPSERPRAECCWFTDGGASSNFPVHFFDAPLPRRPTFAINLRPFHPDHGESPQESENVWMVPSAGGGQLAWWYPLPGAGGLLDRRLGAFLGGIVRTMQNRVDDAQLRMPGQRDRVVHVSLTDDQGGMNLTMDPEAIDVMTRRGREAGAKLARRFTEERTDGEPLGWRDHRWTRLRSAMPSTAEMLSGLADAYAAEPAAPERGYGALLADGHGPPYEMTQGRREQAAVLLGQLTALGQAMRAAEDALAKDRPSPAAQVRMVPPE